MKKFILFLFILLPVLAQAQGEASWWFFGANASVDFNTGIPVSPPTPGSLDTFEGCSAISDSCGNLQMYSDGSTIWDRNGNPMPNGTGLSGNSSSAQSAIIIPDLGAPGFYFVVTIGAGAGLRYSIVSMSLNGGLGDVLPGRRDILIQQNTQEKVTAALSSQGNYYWIVTFDDNPGTYSAYPAAGGIILTSAGVDSVIPATSVITDARGYIRLSPDATKIVNVSIGDQNEGYYCDFDPATGVVSNPVLLTTPGPANRFYGAEFSPNSQLLYLNGNTQDTGNGAGAGNTREILQYNTNGGAGWNSIPVRIPCTGANSGRGALQLGIDGKIYHARVAQPWLGAVNNPDIIGVGCSYRDDAVRLAPGTTSREGLPPFITSFFQPDFNSYDSTAGGTGTIPNATEFCDGTPIQFEASRTDLCPTATVVWDFGDGTMSTSLTPIHTYPGPGTYTVTLTVISGAVTNSISRDFTIYANPIANPVSDVLLCDSDMDGIESRDLSIAETPQVLGGQTNANFDVTYHLTQAGANSGTGAIAMPYDFPVGTTTVYARITNNTSSSSAQCNDSTSFDVIVASGSGATRPDDLFVCDDNNDGFSTFDLTATESQVLNGLPAASFTITYHTTAAGATAGAGVDQIASPSAYNNASAYTDRVFIRLEDNNPGGCTSTTEVDLFVYDSPTANLVADELVCDINNDGTEDIDLSQFDAEVLGTQTNANYIISYHLTAVDATADTNAQSSPFTLTTTTTLYVRIDNDTDLNSNTCEDFTSFTISLDQVPTANPVNTYRLCDDISNNNSEVFDLASRNPEVLLGQDPAVFNIEYFTSQADADLGSVGGATPVNMMYSSGGQTMYARIENVNNPDCYDTTTFDLIVDDRPLATSPVDLELCDISNDGSEDVDLTQFDAPVLNGQTNPTFVVTYHPTQNDADNDTAEITTLLNVSLGTSTVFARVDNSDNMTCEATAPINIILSPEAVANAVTEYRLCDVGNDGTETFDLSTKDAEVLDTQNAADFTIEYFTTQADADLGSVGGATPLPTSYDSAGGTIYARVETNSNTACADTTSFDLFVDPLPLATSPVDLELCDISNDGSEDVDLTQFDGAVLNGQITPSFVVTYHPTQNDADNDTAEITTLFNASLGTSTVYARVDNSDNMTCEATAPINIILSPDAVANAVTEYRLCDVGNDGTETFDLSTKVAEVLDSQNAADFTIEYFSSQTDADLGSAGGATPLPTMYDSAGGTIYARIETNSNTACADTTSFDLFVDPLPLATSPVDLELCDISNDGSEDVDLTQFDGAVLNGQITPSFVVTYHPTQNDADNDTAEITTLFNASLGTSTVYARVDNSDNMTCEATAPINIILSPDAVANAVTEYRLCDVGNDGTETFDLSTKDSEVLDTQNAADFTIEYFSSQADADLGSAGGATPLPTSYDSAGGTIYARIETNSNTACADTTSFDLFVDPLPLAGVQADIIVCDDISNDGSEMVDLSQFDATVLDGQTDPAFNVSYHATQNDADMNTAPLSSPYTVTTSTPTIYARIDNANNESCASTTSFNFVITPRPTANPVMDMITCDDPGNDGSAVFDLGSADVQVLDGQNAADFEITYHNTQQEAIDDVGALPLNYPSNTNTPETIWVRIEAIANPVCPDFTSFTLTVSEQPTAGTTADIVGCDDQSNDGVEEFDFTSLDSDILDGRSPVDFNVTYHRSQADAENDTAALSFPYTNSARSETIYARIENVLNESCYDYSTFEIEVFERPIIANQGPITICAGVSETLDAGPGFTTYLWSTGEMTQTIDVVSGDDYTVTVTNANGCERTATIRVVESDVAVIDRIDVGQFEVNTNSLTAIVTGSGDYEFSLDNFVYQDSPRFENLYPGYYTVYVRDKNGCGTVSMDAVIIGGPPYFTPNQDGYHDTWQVIAVEEIPDATIYIFDRYGKLLKQISPTGRGWDGTYNGNPMPSSDYWYTVELADGRSFRGHFALKR